jgi:hypothetical protein
MDNFIMVVHSTSLIMNLQITADIMEMEQMMHIYNGMIIHKVGILTTLNIKY